MLLDYFASIKRPSYGRFIIAPTYAARLRSYTNLLTQCSNKAFSEAKSHEVHLSNITSEHELLQKIKEFYAEKEETVEVLFVVSFALQ